jgi:hypothetical protein
MIDFAFARARDEIFSNERSIFVKRLTGDVPLILQTARGFAQREALGWRLGPVAGNSKH